MSFQEKFHENEALASYVEGLKSHDVAAIDKSLAEDVKFVTPVKTMGKTLILEFLTALYAGFPDWHYDHDDPFGTTKGPTPLSGGKEEPIRLNLIFRGLQPCRRRERAWSFQNNVSSTESARKVLRKFGLILFPAALPVASSSKLAWINRLFNPQSGIA